MVWVSMGKNVDGNLVLVDGNINKTEYLNILKNNLEPSVRKMGLEDRFLYIHDNDPKHSALIIEGWLLYNTKKILHHRTEPIFNKETLKIALAEI